MKEVCTPSRDAADPDTAKRANATSPHAVLAQRVRTALKKSLRGGETRRRRCRSARPRHGATTSLLASEGRARGLAPACEMWSGSRTTEETDTASLPAARDYERSRLSACASEGGVVRRRMPATTFIDSLKKSTQAPRRPERGVGEEKKHATKASQAGSRARAGVGDSLQQEDGAGKRKKLATTF